VPAIGLSARSWAIAAQSASRQIIGLVVAAFFLLSQQHWDQSSNMKARRCRIVWVQRHIGSTSFEDAQESDHHFERSLDADADKSLWPHSQRLQVMR